MFVGFFFLQMVCWTPFVQVKRCNKWAYFCIMNSYWNWMCLLSFSCQFFFLFWWKYNYESFGQGNGFIYQNQFVFIWLKIFCTRLIASSYIVIMHDLVGCTQVDQHTFLYLVISIFGHSSLLLRLVLINVSVNQPTQQTRKGCLLGHLRMIWGIWRKTPMTGSAHWLDQGLGESEVVGLPIPTRVGLGFRKSSTLGCPWPIRLVFYDALVIKHLSNGLTPLLTTLWLSWLH